MNACLLIMEGVSETEEIHWCASEKPLLPSRERAWSNSSHIQSCVWLSHGPEVIKRVYRMHSFPSSSWVQRLSTKSYNLRIAVIDFNIGVDILIYYNSKLFGESRCPGLFKLLKKSALVQFLFFSCFWLC